MDPEQPPVHNNDPTAGEQLRRDTTFRGYIDELSSHPASNSRMDRARTRIVDAAERLTTWGPLGPIAETGWQVWRRDQTIAGSVLAAALAYRIFIWLLPLALVLVAGLGFASPSTASDTVSGSGLSAYVAQSVASSSQSASWIARLAIIVSGTIVFLYESYVLLRTLRAISAFAWRIPVRAMRNPARQTSMFLLLSLVLVAVMALIPRLESLISFPAGLAVALVALAAVPVYVIVISMLLLPHRAVSWTSFIPGGLLIYATYTIVHLLATLVVVPWVAHKQATYGVLGVAAGMLFLMFVFGRIIELSFSLNAVLLEQRSDKSPSPTPPSGFPT
jgi:membrane protein